MKRARHVARGLGNWETDDIGQKTRRTHLKETCVRNRRGLNWLKIGTSGGVLWTRQWSFEFRKILGISLPAKQLLAYNMSPILGVSIENAGSFYQTPVLRPRWLTGIQTASEHTHSVTSLHPLQINTWSNSSCRLSIDGISSYVAFIKLFCTKMEQFLKACRTSLALAGRIWFDKLRCPLRTDFTFSLRPLPTILYRFTRAYPTCSLVTGEIKTFTSCNYSSRNWSNFQFALIPTRFPVRFECELVFM
jgi:hypothetical protein